MHRITPLEQLDAIRFETSAILKKLASSSRHLAELKGIAGSIPAHGDTAFTVPLFDELMKREMPDWTPA
ncbi:MAG TPA: hypothetical protein VFN66_00985 [Burkholderiales bacterium]|nr:hypothetical protein [Burkholderiales bacterium]